MIVFDLACQPAGHIFEIWFGSTEDYESQRKRGLVSCPYCGAIDVEKAVMAPNVGTKGNQRNLPVPSRGRALTNSDDAVSVANSDNGEIVERYKSMLNELAQVQAKMLEGSDYVGGRFASEARAMHLGESDRRAIHGQASIEEVKALVEEGVQVAPLPLPVRPPGQDN